MAFIDPLKKDNKQLIDTVWQKGSLIPGENPWEWRTDCFGNMIFYADYANIDSVFGWLIDHIVPPVYGGTGNIENLQPVQWEVNIQVASGTQIGRLRIGSNDKKINLSEV